MGLRRKIGHADRCPPPVGWRVFLIPVLISARSNPSLGVSHSRAAELRNLEGVYRTSSPTSPWAA